MSNASISRLEAGRLRSIDALRGAAALAVLLFHAVNYGNNYNEGSDVPTSSAVFTVIYKLLNHGDIGVALFFVISGFCIHLRWAKQVARTGNERIDMWDFWKRRIRRLYPAYFVALCLSMSLVLIAYLRHAQITTLNVYPQPSLKWLGIDFALHALMLHGLHPLFWKLGGNAVLWTLAIEEYFYLMYLGLLSSRRRWGLGRTLAGVFLFGTMVSFVAAMSLERNSRLLLFINSSAPVLWIQWCLGMAAAEAYCRLAKMPKWSENILLVPVWGAAAWAMLKWGGAINDYAGTVTPLLWGMMFLTLMNACIARERQGLWASGRITGPILNWTSGVGLFSYSLYLVHLPVRSAIRFALKGHPASGPLGYSLIAAAMIVGGYFAGKIFFKAVESHFLNSPPGQAAKAPRAAPAVVATDTGIATAAKPESMEQIHAF